MNEFELIEKFFYQQAIHRSDVVLGIGDDCAIVQVPAEQQLVITTDTLVAGVHFFENTEPFDLGFKSLAVNLSDLAAMGATPAWITLALTLPALNEAWLQAFSKGFFQLAKQYNVQLIGGDLTRGPLTITVQAHGLVPHDQALCRSHAQPGDLIYVTNTVGDAALGLLFLQQKIHLDKAQQAAVLNRLHRPEPRIDIGKKLRGHAHAVIDISDGLAADLGHILEKSHVGATIYVDQLPVSSVLREATTPDQAISLALNGGDDYELCFTATADKKFDFNCTCIGKITDTQTLALRFSDEQSYNGAIHGYQHF